MSDVIKIKKGLDIPLAGMAEKKIGQCPMPGLFAIKPGDFHGVVPKVVVKEGDEVKIGTVLFHDKANADVKFVSPASGRVKSINRGEQRRVLEVIVESDGKDSYLDFGATTPSGMNRDSIIERLLQAGAWPYLRQRPYNVIANPADNPKAIFISAFDSSPLAPDMDFVLAGNENALKVGIEVLKKLSPNVHIGISRDATSAAFKALDGVKLHTFSGPHPAGNVGVQIHHVSPINKGEKVWVIQPQEVVSIGNLFSTGLHDFSRVVAVTGSEVKSPAYYNFRLGGSIQTLPTGIGNPTGLRYISGNVLTGHQISSNGFLGFYHSQLTVIPEGNEYEFLGWALPGFSKFSVSRSYFSWLQKSNLYKLNANMHGGERAIVAAGQYDKVMPMDILVEFLIKAILAEDVDKMEQLGIYELVEEDLALCEFVDISKLELQSILRKGINLMIKEMGA